MKRRMIPRERPPQPAVDPKTAGAVLASRHYAQVEMMGKQHITMVDGIREKGKKSTNMLVRVAMMSENPVFADSKSHTLPSSMTNIEGKYPSPVDKTSKEDLVKGGSGDNLYLVSRGVNPGVVPAKYSGDFQSTMKSSYADHWNGSQASTTNNVYATHAGAAQAKDWTAAARRKQELEQELNSIDSHINDEGNKTYHSATSHGLYGRLVPESHSTGGSGRETRQQQQSRQQRVLTDLKGFGAKRGTTMSDTYCEHPLRRSKKWGVSIFDHDDLPDAPLNARDAAKTMSFNGVARRVPTNPSELTMKSGSNVVGSAFNWKGTHTHSSKAMDYSLPSAKLREIDPDTEKEMYTHGYSKYDISKTRYGDSARECDLVRGSIYVVPRDVMAAEKAKRMQP